MSGFLAFLAERRAELLHLTGQHVRLVLVATVIATAIGVPLGVLLTRRPALSRPVLGVAGVLQTVPSLALFGFLIPLPFLGGIGARSAIVALVLYALLPIVRNTWTGLRQVDPAVREAADGMGMTGGQRLRLVELPLALPVIVAGLRVATVVSVGTATIAAAIGAGGLGTYVFRGIATLDTRLILAGAIPAAVLALLADAVLGFVERTRSPARAAVVLGVAAQCAVGLSLPGRGTADVIRVGSKNFTEQVVLGELVAATLEARGFTVQRHLDLGGTKVCDQALRTGQLDVYVEYSGTALADILHLPVQSDSAAVLREVRARYAESGLWVAEPLGFNNTFALVMRPEDSRQRGIRTISDLATHADELRLGLFGEFLERADGMPGLQRAYGFRAGPPPREMDLGLLYPALLAREVDVVVGSSTDGPIAANGLVILDDDRHYFPPYHAVPVARRAALDAHPGLEEALRSLAGRIDATTMSAMNQRVSGDHRPPAEVAREFLRR